MAWPTFHPRFPRTIRYKDKLYRLRMLASQSIKKSTNRPIQQVGLGSSNIERHSQAQTSSISSSSTSPFIFLSFGILFNCSVCVCVFVRMSSIPTSVMATPPYLSSFEFDSAGYYRDNDDDFSSRYLEDAPLEFGDRSKRRRLSFSSSDRALTLGYMNSGTGWDVIPLQNQQHYGSTRISGLTEFADELVGISISTSEEEMAHATSEIQTLSEDAMSFSSLDSSTCPLNPVLPSNPIANARQIPLTAPLSRIIGGQETEKGKHPKVIKGVAYPFALIKPGGSEDDVTLEDINARILMTPVRPVRHPVGDFACRPYGGGPGPSGKAVVGLTRLHTQGGRGSITIIRTKG